jgi:hypothetical protein
MSPRPFFANAELGKTLMALKILRQQDKPSSGMGKFLLTTSEKFYLNTDK